MDVDTKAPVVADGILKRQDDFPLPIEGHVRSNCHDGSSLPAVHEFELVVIGIGCTIVVQR